MHRGSLSLKHATLLKSLTANNSYLFPGAFRLLLGDGGGGGGAFTCRCSRCWGHGNNNNTKTGFAWIS